MLKVGIIGVGHLGRIHVQQWLTIPGIEVIGVYDENTTRAQQISEEFSVKNYQSIDNLIDACQAIDIVTPTTTHFEIAKKCILKSKHIFIEKPVTHTLEEAEMLVKLADEAQIVCQIGHVERYNPAFTSIKDLSIKPMFIESHRLSEFNPRGTDVSVILDLMIHDIDIILKLVKSPVKRISASGVAVISHTADIANARIEFDNGCVANLTCSRISLKKMRKTRIFQKDAYISLDFLNKKSEVVKLFNENEMPQVAHGLNVPITLNDDQKKYIHIDYPHVQDTNAIQQELADFTLSILTNSPTSVPIHDGYHALNIAYKILDKINTTLYSENSSPN